QFATLLAAAACCAITASAAAAAVHVTYGVPYVVRESGPVMADVYVPPGEGPFPGVLVVHGGAWRMGNRAQLAGVARALAERGFTAVAISYRLAPAHKFPAQIDDCKAAVRWMRTEAAKWKIDPEHIGGFGYSAGAHLVALLGTTSPGDGLEGVPEPEKLPSTRLQAVAAGGAPCDFRPIPGDWDGLAFWLGGSPAEAPDQYRNASPATFVTADDPPFFFFHGERDDLVPLLSPTQMHAELTAAGVSAELHVVPKVGHLGCCMDRDSIERAVAFLERELKTSPKL
ncbi:MAG TPA: alpha/beta hydrolase, partial [Lacipirellulaceae bacterium]|nr:alpha/beta hydrolase [Lacipirellulaceae bacterium]